MRKRGNGEKNVINITHLSITQTSLVEMRSCQEKPVEKAHNAVHKLSMCE